MPVLPAIIPYIFVIIGAKESNKPIKFDPRRQLSILPIEAGDIGYSDIDISALFI